jgi:hypothetical protein
MAADAIATRVLRLRTLAARAREIGIALGNRNDAFTLLDYARELESEADTLAPDLECPALPELPADCDPSDLAESYRAAEAGQAAELLRD